MRDPVDRVLCRLYCRPVHSKDVTPAGTLRRDGGQVLKGMRQEVDFIIGLLRAALMMGFVVAVIVALAGLFMIVFGIATGIDRRIQD